MKTTGGLPEALAASISRFSRSEIDAMTTSQGSRESQPDPIEVIESATGLQTEGAGRLLFFAAFLELLVRPVSLNALLSRSASLPFRRS
jgi:hypothetical protein